LVTDSPDFSDINKTVDRRISEDNLSGNFRKIRGRNYWGSM